MAAKEAERQSDCEDALSEAEDELSEDHLVSSLGKFREALLLARGYPNLEVQVRETGIAVASDHLEQNWRFAEVLIQEMTAASEAPSVPDALLAAIERQRRTEAVRVALDECGGAEESEHLPHLRDRLAALAKIYPDEETLALRLRALESVLANRPEGERQKNLSRLLLFRDRLNAADRPETLQRFGELCAPFAGGYPDDPAFSSVLEEMRALWTQYEEAANLMRAGRSKEALQICDAVLAARPANVLFASLAEKAKSREWVVRLVSASAQRAQTFEQKGQYAEALEEWEAVCEIDPKYPGVDSEIMHCAALKQHAEAMRAARAAARTRERR